MRKYLSSAIRHPLFAGSLIMVVGSNSVSFFNYLYHVVMVRALGPANYGELAAIISLIGLIGVVPSSLNLVVVKYVSKAATKQEVAALIGYFKKKIFFPSLLFAFFVLILAPFISSFLNINRSSYLILMAFSFFLSIYVLINRSVLQGLLKFKEMVVSMLAESLGKILIGVFLVYLGFAVSGAIAGFVAATVVGWYITNLYLRTDAAQKTEAKIDFRQMLLFTVPVLIQSFSITSLYSSDLILVKHFFSSYDAGVYALLSTLGRIIFFGAGPISAVMFPLVSQRHARGEDFKKVFIYSALLTIVFALVVVSAYGLFPKTIISFLCNSSSCLSAANLLIWFGVFMSLFTISSLLVSYGLSIGKTRIVFFPLIASLIQISVIWFYHQSLFTVILISILVSALLLLSLLIYLSFEKGKLWK